ncbi:MAG TPA: hypothetical protein VJS63_12645 [Bradyrhizobium sp.]|nr:hypothetical protein [Bradyrhizobium sp.]
MKRVVLIVVLVLVVAFGVGVFSLLKGISSKVFTHRYKLTVTVEANGVKRSGASVIEVNWIEQPQKWVPIPVPHFVAHVVGDAPVVELENGGAIVATLMRADPSYRPIPLEHLVAMAFGLADSDASVPDLQRQTGVRILRGNEIPPLVHFSDRTDPKTATLVPQPIVSGGSLAPAVTFVDARIEMTSAPVTRTLEQSLPWWSHPDRPASVARRAWLQGNMIGEAVGPESLFRR